MLFSEKNLHSELENPWALNKFLPFDLRNLHLLMALWDSVWWSRIEIFFTFSCCYYQNTCIINFYPTWKKGKRSITCLNKVFISAGTVSTTLHLWMYILQNVVSKIIPWKCHYAALFLCQECFLICLGTFTKPKHHILKVCNKSMDHNGFRLEHLLI